MAQTFGPYPGRIRAVHDGDTVFIDLDLGFGVVIESRDWDDHPKLSCRVFGIDARELSTDQGQADLAFAQTLLHPGDRVTVISHGWDKYGGRFDGEIRLADGSDFAARMVESGHADAVKD